MCAWPSVTFKIYQYDVSTRRLSSSLRTSKTSSFRLSLLSCVILLSPVCCSIISRYRVIPRLRTAEVEVVLKTKVGEIGSGCPDAEMEVGTGHTEFGTSLNGWWAEQTDTQMYEQSSNRYNSDIVDDAEKWILRFSSWQMRAWLSVKFGKFPIMSSRMVGFRSGSSRDFRSSRHSQAIGRLGYPLGWVNLSIHSFKDRRKRAKKDSLLPWLFNGLLQPAFCTPRLVYCCCSVYLLFLLKGKYLQIADLKNRSLMSKRALGLRSFAKRMVTINNRF